MECKNQQDAWSRCRGPKSRKTKRTNAKVALLETGLTSVDSSSAWLATSATSVLKSSFYSRYIAIEAQKVPPPRLSRAPPSDGSSPLGRTLAATYRVSNNHRRLLHHTSPLLRRLPVTIYRCLQPGPIRLQCHFQDLLHPFVFLHHRADAVGLPADEGAGAGLEARRGVLLWVAALVAVYHAHFPG